MRWPMKVYAIARPTGSSLYRPGDWALGVRYYRTLPPNTTVAVRLDTDVRIARIEKVEDGQAWLDDGIPVTSPVPCSAIEAVLVGRYRPRANR
jgi:hypothetical protein